MKVALCLLLVFVLSSLGVTGYLPKTVDLATESFNPPQDLVVLDDSCGCTYNSQGALVCKAQSICTITYAQEQSNFILVSKSKIQPNIQPQQTNNKINFDLLQKVWPILLVTVIFLTVLLLIYKSSKSVVPIF